MPETTPQQTDRKRPAKGERGNTDATPTDAADKLGSNTPDNDVEGGRISSADGHFVANHRPSR